MALGLHAHKLIVIGWCESCGRVPEQLFCKGVAWLADLQPMALGRSCTQNHSDSPSCSDEIPFLALQATLRVRNT